MTNKKAKPRGERKVWSRIKECFGKCPESSIVPFQPLIYAVLLFGVGYYVLGTVGPPKLDGVADLLRTATQGALPPIHLAAASSLALFVVGLAFVGLASYTICNLERRRCCLFAVWVLAFSVSLGIFYCFLYRSADYAIHPIRVFEGILRAAVGPDQWSKAICALHVLTVSSFLAVSGLVTALCGFVWSASDASNGEKCRIAAAVRWSKFLVAAGGLLMGTSVWHQLVWFSVPSAILPRFAPVANDYARAVNDVVAFHVTLNVLLLVVAVLPALLTIDLRARQYARKCGCAPDSQSGLKWMKSNGLRITWIAGVGSTFATLLPAVVQIAAESIGWLR